MSDANRAGQFRLHLSIDTDKNRDRVWNPFLSAAGALVEYSVRFDHTAIRIREQRESQHFLIGKGFQGFDIVVTDRDHLDLGIRDLV